MRLHGEDEPNDVGEWQDEGAAVEKGHDVAIKERLVVIGRILRVGIQGN